MSGFNINEVIAEIAKNGVMRNNKFLIDFPMPLSLRNHEKFSELNTTNRVMSLYCETAAVPGIALLTNDVRRYGYGTNEKKPYGAMFTDASMVLRGDAEGKLWTFMSSWMKSIVNYDFETGVNTPSEDFKTKFYPGEVSYKYDPDRNEGYATDVTVRVFADTGTETLRVVLREAFPIYVADIPLNWAARSDYMRIPISLAYSDWHQERLD